MEKKTQTNSITLLALVSLAFVEKNHSVSYYSWIIQQFYLVFDLGTTPTLIAQTRLKPVYVYQ